MSQENVEAFKRAVEAANRRDTEALCEELDSEVEWHPAFAALLRGEATVYRGHEGVRDWLRDRDEVFADIYAEFRVIRDLGDRIVAVGRTRGHGRESGVEAESPLAYVVEFKNSKVTHVRAYLDPKEALEAAGLQ